MFDVITLGSATLDMFVHTDSELLTISTPTVKEKHLCYPSGAKQLIKKFEVLTGGGGTNTAVSFSKLGLKAGYLGHLGTDDHAKMILDLLKKEKVSFIGTKGPEATNFSIILDSIEHDRTILIKRDASDKFDISKIKKFNKKTKWLYMSSLIGTSYRSAVKLFRLAKQQGSKTAANISLYQAEQGAKKLAPLLKNLDIMIYNKEEAQAMLKTRSNDIPTLLKKTRATGPKIAVITDGKNGAFCSDGIYYYAIKASDIKVKESTGAGDAFASGFIAAIIKHDDIEDAMKIALANSQSVIRKLGAKRGLLTWRKALKDVKAYKLKVTKKRL